MNLFWMRNPPITKQSKVFLHLLGYAGLERDEKGK
jgi:hypothetical protein